MKASVIIPHHDRIEHLHKVLDAILDQSIRNDDYEVIVVDDGSSKPVEQFIPSRVTLIQAPHLGAAAARNRGLCVAKGEIVIFIDCDIIVDHFFVENHCRFHDQNPNTVGLGFRKHLDSLGNIRGKDTREKLLLRYGKTVSELKHPWFMTYTCNVSLPKMITVQEPFDENYIFWGLEDIEWGYRLFCQGYPFSFIKNVTVSHLYHDRGMTDQKFQGWSDNLRYTISKHPRLEILRCFKQVFDPQKRADYFESYDQFERVQ